MKALTCEMCGSTNLIKENGLFICQSCGTKYSVEEAKKMMVEGTVNIKGNVKIDKSDDIENVLLLAESAFNGDNYEECYIYANKALELDSKSGKAWVYKMWALDGLGRFDDQFRLDEFYEVGSNALEYANGNEEIINEVYYTFIDKAQVIMNYCNNQIRNYKNIIGGKKDDESYYIIDNAHDFDAAFINSIDEIAKKCVDIKCSVPIEFICSDPECIDEVVDIANLWILYSEGFNKRLNLYNHHLADSAVEARKNILNMITEGLPNDKLSSLDSSKINNEEISNNANTSSSGCYIATAVYGSYDCPEVWTLRRFRDFTLDETWYGRLFTKAYYATSPTFVKYFGNIELFKSQGKKLLDKWVVKLNRKGYESTPYKDKY